MTHIITDIHAHVLPGVDDGPEDLTATQALLATFHSTGVHRVFCTSHYHSPYFDVKQSDLEQGFSAVTQARSSHSLELALGAENRISAEFIADIQAGTVHTLGSTNYVLVEFETPKITSQALDIVYELIVRGYRPIMAHPERNLALQRKPALADTLLDAGLLLQATAVCFQQAERHAHQSAKLAWSLLRQGKISVIASDAHNTTSRPPDLMTAYDNISLQLGSSVAEELMSNANAIWNNEMCEQVKIEGKGAKRTTRLFRRS
jgi:protein-tyrosine phosphatase